MSDEEIIKMRLLIDGDGSGHDRRINTLMKLYLRWCSIKKDAPDYKSSYDRLINHLAACRLEAEKSDLAMARMTEEVAYYKGLSSEIEKGIEVAKGEIEERKKELALAKQIRKNKMEFDMLAKIIKQQPDREESLKRIDTLKAELNELNQKKAKYEEKSEKRRKQFALLMHEILELTKADEDESDDSDDNASKDIQMDSKDDDFGDVSNSSKYEDLSKSKEDSDIEGIEDGDMSDSSLFHDH